MYIMIAMKKLRIFWLRLTNVAHNKQTPIKIKRETATDMAVSFHMAIVLWF